MFTNLVHVLFVQGSGSRQNRHRMPVAEGYFLARVYTRVISVVRGKYDERSFTRNAFERKKK